MEPVPAVLHHCERGVVLFGKGMNCLKVYQSIPASVKDICLDMPSDRMIPEMSTRDVINYENVCVLRESVVNVL